MTAMEGAGVGILEDDALASMNSKPVGADAEGTFDFMFYELRGWHG